LGTLGDHYYFLRVVYERNLQRIKNTCPDENYLVINDHAPEAEHAARIALTYYNHGFLFDFFAPDTIRQLLAYHKLPVLVLPSKMKENADR